MATTSRVPAAILALHALVEAAMPDGVLVSDGPRTEDADSPEIVAIGTNDGPEAASAAQRPAALGAQSREETFDIFGTISVFGATTRAARERAYELLALLEDALRDTPTLTAGVQTVRVADLTGHSLNQRLTEQGPYVSVPFTVSCAARI